MLPTFIVQLPLLRVWLNLLHNDIGIQDPQEDPNLADEHPLQPLCQLTDVNIQDDLHQVALPGIWEARGRSVMASEVGESRQTCHCVCFDTEEEVVAAVRHPSSGKEESGLLAKPWELAWKVSHHPENCRTSARTKHRPGARLRGGAWGGRGRLDSVVFVSQALPLPCTARLFG